MTFNFDNSFARLPDALFRRTQPAAVTAPQLLAFNRSLASQLGLQTDVDEQQLIQWFSGNQLPEGADPLAMAYAGHQFGQFVPQLGDGRALLLGQVIDQLGQRRDIQLKGSGRTPFSRGGDGRSALGPVIREYLVSEAMHALGVPTTRALAAVLTGDTVYREEPLPGAILTRVASSHIRVGSFQYLAARGDVDNLRVLARHVIDRHYPDAADADSPWLALLQAVCKAQAKLVAHWMSLGFIHGVMNTDNMTLSGETIDYGPCAFMDNFHPETVFSSIDHGGRYAWRMQPAVAQWNLSRFAECLLPLMGEPQDQAIAEATEVIKGFMDDYQAFWLQRMGAKIGLSSVSKEDQPLIDDLLTLMTNNSVDFTLLFRYLGDLAENPSDDARILSLFDKRDDWNQWSSRWMQRIESDTLPATQQADAMRNTNPAVIPRNHRIEQAITAAVKQQDFSLFDQLQQVLAKPFDESGNDIWMEPPAPTERVCQTFCGT